MLERRSPGAGCPAERFQIMVSGKYKLRILWGLGEGPRRYGEIKRGLLTGGAGTKEIADRVLSRELKQLASMGMIVRSDYGQVPPKVDYALTEKGRRFLPVVAAIHEWGERHLVAAELPKERSPSPSEQRPLPFRALAWPGARTRNRQGDRVQFRRGAARRAGIALPGAAPAD